VTRWIVRIAAGAAVSGLILAALLSFTDVRTVWGVLRRTGPAGALAAFALYALAYVPRAQRLAAIGVAAPLRTLLAISVAHAAINKLLPLRAGELSYPWLARRAAGQRLGEALVGLVYLRVLDIAGVAVLFSATLAGRGAAYRGDATLSMAFALALLAGSLGALFFLRPLLRATVAACERVVGKRALLERGRRAVDAFPALRLGAHVRLAALTIAAWLLVYGSFSALLRAFGHPLGAAETVLGSTAGVIASVLPVQGLGSFGTLEAGWAMGMALVGLDVPTAVATGVGVQLVTFAYAMLLGAWGWHALRRPTDKPAGGRG
jgi:hypothetical protein